MIDYENCLLKPIYLKVKGVITRLDKTEAIHI